ncbi:hypothetical protein CANARDRAFT_26286 [[Candida] arabinofermentans NRRL YB-2248]|uniref:tRNA-splicing endonuclease subunit Sen2 n=1 Tax=[Candida] arabinofermentans NRRL YB-2248 TaxID=983967 RepID=A0A1E4T8P6_9ASCO|nr:hypothetical protein CANARDRAFT_26286 [[Candida] arabinofermentans NRRL YB-2248]
MPPKGSSEHLQKYVQPLPVDIIQLPELIPHNPLSWVIVIYSFLQQSMKMKKSPIEVRYENMTFKVDTLPEMKYLWDHGFFGKGILSRSEPTWLDRTERRLLKTNGSLTSEEIVKERRRLREEFKTERKKLDDLERTFKLENNLNELQKLESKRHLLTEKRTLINKTKPTITEIESDKDMRLEDKELIISDTTIKRMEYLELMPVESLFLLLLNSIKIKNPETGSNYTSVQLFKKLATQCGSITPDNYFITQFLIYYHYKSLGWCVKSGMKFSSDFILYERGPPFQHAEFAITIVHDKQVKDFTYYGSINRVVGVVKKTMVLSFVQSPPLSVFQESWDALSDNKLETMFDLLKLYDIDEISYKRWSPSRTRE